MSAALSRGALPDHHPGDTLLLDYAGGSLCEGASLAVATHLAFCPCCRHAVVEMEAIGGVLLDGLEPDALSSGCLDAVMARLDREGLDHEGLDREASPCRPAAPRPAPRLSGPRPRFPEPLRGYLHGALDAEGGLDRAPWRFVQRGIRGIDLVRAPGANTRLIRMAGGAAAPRHTHGGVELTVVLEGGFSDELGAFGPGDIAVGDGSLDHQPVADPEGCLCLTVTIGGLRLTGPLGRWFNRFITF